MAKENIHQGHRDRLREKALHSELDTLAEHEVLEIMLSFVIPYKDTNPIAHELIDTFGSLREVLNSDIDELTKVKGVGEKTAKYLALQKVFYRAMNQFGKNEELYITNTKDAVIYCKTLLNMVKVEKLYLICLNPKNKVVFTKLISSGDYNKVNIDVKKLTKIILAHDSYRVILCHNHPDGDAKPSYEDNRFTKALATNMYINNIQLVDHIIIGDNEYYSYNTSGELMKYILEAKEYLNGVK